MGSASGAGTSTSVATFTNGTPGGPVRQAAVFTAREIKLAVLRARGLLPSRGYPAENTNTATAHVTGDEK
jgi:hypothetical protein